MTGESNLDGKFLEAVHSHSYDILICLHIYFSHAGVSSIALKCQEVPENDFAAISITYSRRTANKFITS